MRATLPLLVLCACGSKATDGPRWSSTTYEGWIPTPPRDTADPTGGSDTGGDTDDTSVDPRCIGGGPASVSLGRGGQSAFDTYNPGDPVTIVRSPDTDQWGLTFEISVEGLDTTEPVSAVMWIDGGLIDTTYLGVLLLQCSPPLPDWDVLHVDFEPEHQGAAQSGALAGTWIDVALTLTDHLDRSASQDLVLELAGP
ncbi:MAG TPA: hypothetical protein ENK18_17745 [Deltaproteobacteria bacterium]|nr:hypothetical protein [Deltaproteobacteria bacterium]